MNDQIILSVCIITYNHEKYIEQAILSVLNQKVTFKFEVILSNDASTDGTDQVIQKIIQTHPNSHLIKYLNHNKNLGIIQNFKDNITKCQGKYVAILEGDDYWTDMNKLQKQVDFLENNPTYSLCSHRFSILNSADGKLVKDSYSNISIENSLGYEIDMEVYLNYYLTKTLTVVFRKEFLPPEISSNYKYFRDVHLFFHLLKLKKGFFMNFDGGVYRLHDGGVYSSTDKLKKTEIAYFIYKELYKKNKEVKGLRNKFVKSFSRYMEESIKTKSISKTTLLNSLFSYLFYSRSVVQSAYFVKLFLIPKRSAKT